VDFDTVDDLIPKWQRLDSQGAAKSRQPAFTIRRHRFQHTVNNGFPDMWGPGHRETNRSWTSDSKRHLALPQLKSNSVVVAPIENRRVRDQFGRVWELANARPVPP